MTNHLHKRCQCLVGVMAVAFLAGCQPPMTVGPQMTERWDNPALWTTDAEGQSSLLIDAAPAVHGSGIEAVYHVVSDTSYVEMRHAFTNPLPTGAAVAFNLKSGGTGDLEIKFMDDNGSVFGRRISLSEVGDAWKKYVVTTNHVEYWWGGDDTFSGLTVFSFAISGSGKGRLWLDEVGLAEPGASSSLTPIGSSLDPDCELPGYGIRQRRAAQLNPEDPLVLEWMKQMQDTATPEKQLISSMEGTQLQTFNNALAASAFVVKGEKERAERILDFFRDATDRDNMDPTLQNFFYSGEARGFFDYALRDEENGQAVIRCQEGSDRWMGDMVWLLFAYKNYDQAYGAGRYNEIEGLIHDLIVSWYTESSDGHGGYVQHGWRNGDENLHEASGHHEGNIDAYAYFMLIGDTDRADRIREWLEAQLQIDGLPLDLYTWRVMAFGEGAAELLDVPDCNLNYRKTVSFNGRDVVGVWHGPDRNMKNNIWIDGVGHMACAYFAVGNEARGNFYANQLDLLVIDRDIEGVHTHGIPYTVSHDGGYDWVDLDKGFLSTAAWYVFAKNQFNPMTLK